MINDRNAATTVQGRPGWPALGAGAASMLVHGVLFLVLVGAVAGPRLVGTASDKATSSAAARPMFLADLKTLDALELPPGGVGAGSPAAYRQPVAGIALSPLPMPPESFREAVQAWDGGFAAGSPPEVRAIDIPGKPRNSLVNLRSYFTVEVRQAALRDRYSVEPADRLYALFPEHLYAAVWQAVREAAIAHDVPPGATITRAAFGFTPPRFAPVVADGSLAFEAPVTSGGD